jgi:hypothetical protein
MLRFLENVNPAGTMVWESGGSNDSKSVGAVVGISCENICNDGIIRGFAFTVGS